MTIDASSPTPPAEDDSAEAAPMLCPGCGYDLRGATNDRCSECGLAIDRRAIRTSDIPWAHRRRIGRVKAFWRTVWYVTLDKRLIRHELARPQDRRDSGWFRGWVAACVAVGLVAGAAFAAGQYGLGTLAIHQRDFSRAGRTPLPGYVQDLAVPWSAGITLVPAVPLYVIALGVYLTGVGRSAVRLKGYPPEHRERARALMTYAAAPLAWLLPAALCHALALGFLQLEKPREGEVGPRAMWLTFELLAALLAGVALFSFFHRSGEWFTRSHHAGAGRFAAGVLELLGRSLLGLILLLGAVPWCIGLGWVVWDSFR
jgi:hypothetical protein